MGNEKDGGRDGAVEIIEAVGGFNVGFISSVESFDKLFKRSEFGGDGVKILEAGDGFMGDGVIGYGEVKKIDGFIVRRVAVGDGGDFLTGRRGADGFVDRGDGGEDAFGVMDVIGSDGSGFGGEEKERIKFSGKDFDISLVAGDKVIDLRFKRKVELMAEKKGCQKVLQRFV